MKILLRTCFFILSFFFTTCGIDNPLSTYFSFKIISSSAMSESLSEEGEFEPLSIKITIKDIKLVLEDESSESMISAKNKKSYSVINRLQLIGKKLTDESYNKKKMTKIQIIIENQIEAVSTYKKDHKLILDDSKGLRDDFIIEFERVETLKGMANYTLVLNVLWGKTIVRTESGGVFQDTLQAPSFSFNYF